MKNLHIPTILVTLGLVGLVAILSGQNMVGSPRVTVHNPLGVPGWVPSDVWMARFGIDPATGSWTYQDYTVPAGHFALIKSMARNSGGFSNGLVDSGSGFLAITGGGNSGATFEPGIVVDEGATIRVDTSASYAVTLHGYLIPK